MNSTFFLVNLFVFMTGLLMARPFVRAADCITSPNVTAPAVTYSESIANIETYRKLLQIHGKLSFVKYTVEKSGLNRVFFQNTRTYEFHYHFLKNEITEYETLTPTQYNEFLFTPSLKKFSAGSIYHAPCFKAAEFETPGIMGFTVYFQGAPNFDEIVDVHSRLSKALELGGDRLTFIFENKPDYIKYKMLLSSRGIPSISFSALTGGAL